MCYIVIVRYSLRPVLKQSSFLINSLFQNDIKKAETMKRRINFKIYCNWKLHFNAFCYCSTNSLDIQRLQCYANIVHVFGLAAFVVKASCCLQQQEISYLQAAWFKVDI